MTKILIQFLTCLFVFSLSHSNLMASTEKAKNWCMNKAVAAATMVATVNNPGAKHISSKIKSSKKKNKNSLYAAVFEVQLSQNDKTKTYEVEIDFNDNGKSSWCQITKVTLTGIPL